MKTTQAPPRATKAGMFAAAFDDLRRGDEFESAARSIGERDVAVFAALSGDSHPAHVDPEWAANGPFGRPIAHGLLVLSCAAGALPLDPERVLALRRLREVVFKRPLIVGEAIVVRCRVTALRALDESTGLVECEWRIVGTDDKLRARVLVEVLWCRGTRDVDGTTDAGIGYFQSSLPEAAGDDELSPVEVTEDGIRVLI